MDKSLKIIVKGYVQGVGFRWFVQRLANSLGISGTVRNLPNGDVEIFATAPISVLNDFVASLYSGPGNVSEILQEESPPVRTKGFHIVF